MVCWSVIAVLYSSPYNLPAGDFVRSVLMIFIMCRKPSLYDPLLVISKKKKNGSQPLLEQPNEKDNQRFRGQSGKIIGREWLLC